MASLFGEDFEIDLTPKSSIKALVNKVTSITSAEDSYDNYDITKALKSSRLSIKDQLAIIYERVLRVLGKQKSNIQVITSMDDLDAYIDKAIEIGRIAIDTETNNSTDPVTCKLMGLCLYTPGQKQVYIPVNHVNLDTRERLSPQLTELDCASALQRIIDAKTYIVMHNGKFDYEVLKCTCGVECAPNWDTLIGARIIDENKYSEKRTSLKYIYTTEIDPSQAKYDLESLFENIPYEILDPEIFALYAATDSLMTDKVYLWEIPYFEGEENKRIRWLAENIEMPIVKVTAEIELRGVCIDQELGERLKIKYSQQLEDTDKQINATLEALKDKINDWRKTATEASHIYVSANSKMSAEKIEMTYPFIETSGPRKGERYKIGKSKGQQLEDPINLGSSTQLAILFYDVLGADPVNPISPRATGEEELEALAAAHEDDENFKICKLLLKRRGIVKLISTYIDVIPELAKHWPDGRIRYRLMSMGTDTGRFASGGKFRFLDENGNQVVLNSINSQNIPSHSPEIRLMFQAAPGYKIVGSDYSGQEVRLAAFLSQDKKLLQSYAEDKDVYAMIASEMFGYPYEDCLEFYPEGTQLEIDGQTITAGYKTHVNKAGKERRAVGKTMVLAGNYGMGGAGAGSLMNKSAEEGEELLNKYFSMFGDLKNAIDASKQKLRGVGYVEDVIGRRRHLPDINLEKYTVSLSDEANVDNFNPFLICSNRSAENDPRILFWKAKINEQIEKSQSWQRSKAAEKGKAWEDNGEMSNKAYEKLAREALSGYTEKAGKREAICFKNTNRKVGPGVIIQANTGRIAQAERQGFNAMIQGSAGTLTKKAMLDIANDEELKKYDAHLIITVHDEVLVECKEEYAELVEKRLPEIMINAALELGITAPRMKCDPYCVSRWYADTAAVAIRDEFKKLEKGDEKKGIAPMTRENAIMAVCKNHIEAPEASIIAAIETGGDLEF